MKVLYDHQIFLRQRFGGVSRYFAELITHFGPEGSVCPMLPFRYATNHYLEQLRRPWRRGGLPGRLVFPGKLRLERFLQRRLTINPCRRAIQRGNYDLFHPTYYDPYFLDLLGAKPFVLTVYDLIAERFADTFWKGIANEQVEWKRRVIPRARRIIALSESTKRDLIELHHVEAARVSVVHLAGSVGSLPPSPLETPPRFLLYVGERWGYKNFSRLLEGVRGVVGGKLKLFCAGGGDFNPAERELLARLGMTDDVVQREVTDGQLAFLYRQAALFVFPSLYEGFGIPVLEALACGCPAAVSATSSFPEVGGDAVAYFNPEDAESIGTTVRTLLADERRRSDLVQRGAAQARKFSWERCARETLAVYQEAVG